jgi:hypothetical protein
MSITPKRLRRMLRTKQDKSLRKSWYRWGCAYEGPEFHDLASFVAYSWGRDAYPMTMLIKAMFPQKFITSLLFEPMELFKVLRSDDYEVRA